MDLSWKHYLSTLPEGMEPPERPVVEFKGYQDTWEPLVKCMQEKGWKSSWDPDTDQGGGEYDVDQSAAYGLAFFECEAQYPKYVRPPWDEGEMERMWDHFTKETIPCLEGEGYTVSGFPSKEAFVDQYFAERRYPVPSAGLDLPDEVREKCPDFPDWAHENSK